MVEYEVEPKSRSEIRMLAYELRRRLKLENELFFPIIDLLDVMEIIYNDFSYEVVEDNELEKGIHAETDVRTGKIRIRQDVFDGACEGNGSGPASRFSTK